jgi:hypothetical protein
MKRGNISHYETLRSAVSNTFLHRKHQHAAQGLDPSGSKTSILYVYIHTTTRIVNNGISKQWHNNEF